MVSFDWSAERTEAEWAEAAEQFEQMASGRERSKQESWERSDTDGFLSQWAAGVMASRYRAMAAVARQHGVVEVTTLITLDGQTPEVFEFEGQWGWCYGVKRETGTEFVGFSKASTPRGQHAHYAKKGYTQGVIRAHVYFDRSDRMQVDWSRPVEVVTVDLNVEEVSA